MANGAQDAGKAAAKAWMRQRDAAGERAARPVLLFGLLGTALAIGQACCVATVLAAALDAAAAESAAIRSPAFAVLALLRAGLGGGEPSVPPSTPARRRGAGCAPMH